MKQLLYLILLFFIASNVNADEIRPGYLELKEVKKQVFSVVWKVPVKGNNKLGLKVTLPDDCKNNSEPVAQFINGAYIQRWLVTCQTGLIGKPISIQGLHTTSTDVLLRLEFLNNTSQSVQLTTNQSSYLVPAQASSMQVIKTYTWLGIEHILLGIDHLLFVFALLLIVSNLRTLLWTITAFTIAHSITLAGATLGWVHMPQAPVEAVIALSIVFLAVEIIHVRLGKFSIAQQWPWLVAFVFGLLHGFGFAGALSEVGIPQHAIPLALVFFNIGVELGQVLFVAVVLALGWLLHYFISPTLSKVSKHCTVYAIGSLASFWLIERVASFWG